MKGHIIQGRSSGRPHVEVFAWMDEADGHLVRYRVLVERNGGTEPLRIRLSRFHDDGAPLDLRFDVADADRLAGFLQKGGA
jgi:hypothetical protein